MRLNNLITKLQDLADSEDLDVDPKVMLYSEEAGSWYDLLSVEYDSTMNFVEFRCIFL